ncbi:hypothetical protein Ga0102493_111569 [Erythrobacter litoralis]|uniref:Uncharacterized protein n=1 Tax=Erythrobacter litoralis TaxID=39960 RepID=A0A074MWR0_9SPHN|nr:hypothetical protein [Erythrobacter litoralis]AOL22595.1 hypothetical protein Ga0102493_111569 [Erythrobacter litoralis]KEO90037.1 hypothetical protein EH32_03355 [Erythrobacter litoralis]
MPDISSLSDKQLTNLEKNYLANGVEVGGPYSLAEVRLESLRRTPSALDPVAVAKAIVELARASEDNLTTYGELWNRISPGQPWKGNATQKAVANALTRVVAYCVTHKMPIITVLVVRTDQRDLSELAVENICREAQELGVDTGPDPKAFIEAQRVAAMALADFPRSERPAT